jgi:hypothetical protein
MRREEGCEQQLPVVPDPHDDGLAVAHAALMLSVERRG